MSPDQIVAAIFDFLRRQYPVIVLTVLAALTVAGAYLLVVRSTYTAQATVIIDTRKIQAYQGQSMFNDVPIDSPAVESQLELIRSDNIARSVLRKLNLATDPEFARYGGGFVGNVLYYVYALFEVGDTGSNEAIARRALKEFTGNLSARRIGTTYVIEIAYRSASPARAAEIANAVADAYITDQLDAKYQSARRAGDWLSERLLELRNQATTAEQAIVAFKSKNNIVDAGGRSIAEQQVAELNSQILSARTQTAEARARLDRIAQIMTSDVREATVTDTLRSEVVSKLRSQYLEIANREADLSARYGRAHLAAVNLRNQMHEIGRSISSELGRLAETYKSDYEIARQRESEMQQSLDGAVSTSQVTGAAQVKLKELESNSQTYRSLYENFLQRYTESLQQQSFPITEARVISTADQPTKRSSPKTILVIAIACGGGLMLGLGLAIMRDLADRVIRTSRQAEALFNADCIATLPLLASGAMPLAPEDPSWPPRTIRRDHAAHWSIAADPFSPYTEGLRSIKAAIDHSSGARTGRIIGLSSALPNEGKSTIAASLALLGAQTGGRTILIDGDLRNPTLSQSMAASADVGLLEVLAGTATLDDVIWIDPASGMHFLPTVLRGAMTNSSEILGSDAMAASIERLARDYDYVIVDLSPLAPVVDVRSTGRFILQYLLVVEWGKTNIDVLDRALARAPNLRDNLLGVVLNKADTVLLKRYECYDPSYYAHPNDGPKAKAEV